MDFTPEQSERLTKASSILRSQPAKRPRQCEHIKANGEFCRSPALRGRNYCYFHLTKIGRRMRAERNHARAQANAAEAAVVPLELPLFEDAHSIQIALMQVVDALLHNRIDTKRAGLVLYALQTASSNLARIAEAEPAEDALVAGRYDDFEEDFELGDDVPELKTDPDDDARQDEEYTAETQVEQVMEACATLEQARKEAEDAESFETDEQGTEIFRCTNPVSGFFCSIQGPLSRHNQPNEVHQQYEREAGSQRLELVPSIASAPDGTQEVGRGRQRHRQQSGSSSSSRHTEREQKSAA